MSILGQKLLCGRCGMAISYWERAHYSRPFAIFEYTLDALIIAYFIGVWRNKPKAFVPPSLKEINDFRFIGHKRCNFG